MLVQIRINKYDPKGNELEYLIGPSTDVAELFERLRQFIGTDITAEYRDQVAAGLRRNGNSLLYSEHDVLPYLISFAVSHNGYTDLYIVEQLEAL